MSFGIFELGSMNVEKFRELGEVIVARFARKYCKMRHFGMIFQHCVSTLIGSFW